MNARAAAYEGKLEEADRLLTKAKRLCGPDSQPYIERVEQLMADRRSERENADAGLDAALRPADASSATRFKTWIETSREAVSESVSAPTCAPRSSPDYGTCEAFLDEARKLRVRYWQDDEKAFRFTLLSQTPLSCQDLGPHRIVRRWSREGKSFQLCELMEHHLRSLTALLELGEDSYQLDVFSHAYEQRDATLRAPVDAKP